MSFCFIVEYLNVKVFRNFRDADTFLLIWLVPQSFPALFFTIIMLIKDVYRKLKK